MLAKVYISLVSLGDFNIKYKYASDLGSSGGRKYFYTYIRSSVMLTTILYHLSYAGVRQGTGR